MSCSGRTCRQRRLLALWVPFVMTTGLVARGLRRRRGLRSPPMTHPRPAWQPGRGVAFEAAGVERRGPLAVSLAHVSRSAVVTAVGIAGLMWVLSGRLARIEPLMVTVLCSVTAALALEAPVAWLSSRGVRRSTAALGLLAGIAGVLAVAAVAGVSMLVSQSRELTGQVPVLSELVADSAESWLGVTVSPEQVEQFALSDEGPLAWALDTASRLSVSVAQAAGYTLTGALFVFYLLAEGPQLRSAVISRVPPRTAATLGSGFSTAVAKAGGWLRVRFVLAVVCGVFCWVVLMLLQVPSALFLALWCALVSQLIPVLGTYLAVVLPSAVALLVSPVTAVVFLVLFVVYQQVENLVVAPRLSRWALNLHPAVGLFAVVAAALMWGPAVALVASPVTATAMSFLAAYVPPARAAPGCSRSA